MDCNFFMTTLKIHPSKSGVNFGVLTFTEPSLVGAHFAPSLRYSTSTDKLFVDIVDLVKLNEPTGQLDEDTLVCDLQRFFEAADADKSRDLRLWRDSNGKLVGFGQLLISEHRDEIEGYLYFDVHPTRRGVLESEILQWSEQRMREVGKERSALCSSTLLAFSKRSSALRSLSIKLRSRSREDRTLRLENLEQQGFTTERSFLTMACSLNQSLSISNLPTGFTVQTLSGDRNLKPWVELFNESFIDHWDYHELTVASVNFWLKNPHYKPELNLIAVAPDGTFAAFCVGYINWEENARTGCNDGWVKLLGTRRGFRKLGLGRSLLLACMRQLEPAGIDQVKLGVDAQSLTSATRLYQSIGFQSVNTWLSYVKEIQP
jgi:ribosomal protein S18 acetylase RimI-like enzyme